MTTTGVIPQWDTADLMTKALRESGLSVNAAAAQLDVSRMTVSRWLNGRTTPSRATLMAWAQITGVDFDWLCARRDSNPQPSDLCLLDVLEDDGCPVCGGAHDIDDCPSFDEDVAALLGLESIRSETGEA